MGNPPWRSLLDGIGNGLGYAWIICVVGAIREVLGSGKLLGMKVCRTPSTRRATSATG